MYIPILNTRKSITAHNTNWNSYEMCMPCMNSEWCYNEWMNECMRMNKWMNECTADWLTEWLFESLWFVGGNAFYFKIVSHPFHQIMIQQSHTLSPTQIAIQKAISLCCIPYEIFALIFIFFVCFYFLYCTCIRFIF